MKRKRIFYFFLILFLIVLFYKEIIFKEKYLWDDILYQWYPFLTYLKESIKNLKLPVWNPYVFSGMPFLNDIQSQVFYPLNYFFLFLNGLDKLTYYQVELIVIFHIFLIFIFSFIFLKSLKIDEKISFIGGIILTFSSFVTLRTIQLGPLAVFTYFPIVSYFFLKFLKEEKISKNAIYGGIILGLSFLAGYPQFSLFLIYNLLSYFLLNIIITKKINRFQIINTFIFFLIGLGIAMIQFYPTYKYLPFTVRKKLSFEEASDGSLSFLQLINIFIPKFFGSTSGEGTETIFYWLYPYRHYYWEAGIYLGILPFFFALYGLIYSKRKEKYLFFIPAIVALLFAFGKNFFLYNLFFNILPGLKQFRFPCRFLAVYIFNLTVLSVFGIENFLKEKERKNFYKFLIFFLIISIILFLGFKKKIPNEFYKNSENQFFIYLFFLIITIFIFFFKIKKAITFLIIVGLISYFDLFIFGSKFSKSSISDEDYYPYTSLVSKLQREREGEFFRINSRIDSYMILKRNEGCLWKLELLEGYTPLNLANFSTFHINRDRKCELLNVKYKIKVEEDKMGLVENEKYLERAKLYYDYIVVNDNNKILELLNSDTFDIYNKLILKKEIPGFVKIMNKEKIKNSIKILKYDIDEIIIEAETNYPAILLLSEIYYPEWQVKVDNRKEEIYEANYLLRAVPIKEGKHIIKFYYDKKNILIGLSITILTLLFVIFLLAFLGRQSKN
ncbi:MAG: YfhO family protein [candidate division WOR-3 bacterium]|nr:YfhO family protein [candidate division WOR-3 bacterium]MDW8114516.1 YfhO family protein [candidate division WOR-3 bacterium]